MSRERRDDIADRLSALSEEIADLAIDELRGALRSGGKRPESEKRLTQARRAVEKAVHLLRSDASRGDSFDD